jgi:T-complex protein 1 subunit beta
LKSVHVDNAAAEVLVDIAVTQDEQVGDGTTSVAVLAGELLREAEHLVNARIHPQTICAGYRMAVTAARQALTESAMELKQEHRRREDLLEIAKTTLSSKLLHHGKQQFAELAVYAVLRSQNLEHIVVLKNKVGA